MIRSKRVRLAFKLSLLSALIYFLVLPLVPDFDRAVRELRSVNPALLALGLGCEVGAWFAYSMLTRSALGHAGDGISPGRLFRIQMSTKALGNVVPGGSVAGPALGYRLMVRSGVSGRDAGFALATAALGSAVALNVLLWIGLIISIPVRGVNPLYASAALFGALLMTAGAVVVIGLMDGKTAFERPVRWIARTARRDPDRATATLRHIGSQLDQLAADRAMLVRVAGWATANWLLDATALWVFLRAYGQSVGVDGLLIAFGIANVLAAIPVSPGGLGIVEWVYFTVLVGFGLAVSGTTLGVGSYRVGQLLFPIPIGALMYMSLRFGPWSLDHPSKRRSKQRPKQRPGKPHAAPAGG